MNQFSYHEPKTVKEACGLLSQLGGQASILAGGTDLIPKMRGGQTAPEQIVNIKKISGLDSIELRKKGLLIGTLTKISEVINNSHIINRFPILSTSAASIGSHQVRNLATVGGNLCNASPSADMAPSLMVLDSIARIEGIEGQEEIPLEKFFTKPGQVALKQGEMLTGIYVPFRTSNNAKQIYLKHTVRRAMEIAVASVAMCLGFEEKTNNCDHARIALGAVAPTPIRAKKTEKLIFGKSLENLSLPSIKERICMEASPISDVRASADYRSEILSTLTVRAIESLWTEEKINGKTC